VDEDMRPFRFQHLAHILETRVQDLGEGRRAVVNRRNIAGLADILRHVRGPGDEHGVLIAHCQPPTIVARSVCPAPARRHYFEIVFQNSMDWNNPYLSVTYIFHSMNLSFRFAQRHLMKNQEDRGLSARKARGRPRDWNDNTDQNMIKSLDRAMSVFEYISQARGKNLSSIADELAQSPATIYRILVTLESKGLVEFDGDAQLWHIGPRAFVIGARFLRRTSLVERARPILRKLMETTGETANLGIEREGSVLFVSQVETHASIRAFFPPGTLSPMHASGIGKALLAQMDRDRQARYLAPGALQAFTARTFVDRLALEGELQKIRDRGYA